MITTQTWKILGNQKKDWLESFLELPGGIPSHDTFNRIFRSLDPEEFEKCFIDWVELLRKNISKEIVAIDGKTIRRSFDNANNELAVHIVSAWAKENGLSLGQVAVSEKSNEITAIPRLLQLLSLEDCIVTIDAMGCQKKIAEEICKQKADYVLELKKNHEKLFNKVEIFFEGHQSNQFRNLKYEYLETKDKNHGRVEIRRYWITEEIAGLNIDSAWTDLQSIGMVERIRITGEKTEREIHFYLTSLKADVKEFARAARGHWSIENSLHWVLDVTFREDDSRVRKDYGAQNLAMLKKIALNLIKANSTRKASMRSKRRIAALDQNFLLEILLDKSVS